ncbi:MAG TPA: response regulator [Spongiibacteraceae bacterium]|nr:response regulator [Spongiibacteraceae bacterium]
MQVLKFLVVDDASFIRDLLKKQLRDAYPGAQITDVPSAVRAQVALKTQNFDLILCDWEMPEMSGEEFLLWLRAHPQHATMPFIMVTSRGERDFIIKAVQAGVSDYLGKPFKPEMLINKVNKVLRAAGKDLSPGAASSGGATQGIAGSSVAALTGRPLPTASPSPAAVLPAAFQMGAAAAPSPARNKMVARGQAQLHFAQFNTQCVIKDISLQTMSGIIKREAQLPAIFEPVVISIVAAEGESVARLNGYVHGVQAAENRIDASVLKVTIRFVDDDPVKLDHLSRYIEKL